MRNTGIIFLMSLSLLLLSGCARLSSTIDENTYNKNYKLEKKLSISPGDSMIKITNLNTQKTAFNIKYYYENQPKLGFLKNGLVKKKFSVNPIGKIKISKNGKRVNENTRHTITLNGFKAVIHTANKHKLAYTIKKEGYLETNRVDFVNNINGTTKIIEIPID